MKKILWRQEELVQALGQEISQTLADITGASKDTRNIKQGDMFFALKGENFNGNRFANEALNKGASLCIVDEEVFDIKEKDAHKVILVDNVADAINKMAIYRRNSLTGKVIGVTGSLGKTSTKEMLKLALSECGKVYASPQNLNNHYGLPLSLIQAPVDSDFCILEMGMNHSGEIRNLSSIARPDVAIIVNVQPAHMQFFSSINEIAYAKAEIFEHVKTSGIGIINANNESYYILNQQASKYGLKTITFGEEGLKSDCYIERTEKLQNGNVLVNIKCMGEHIQQEFDKAVGSHLIYNSLAVLASLILLGVDLKKAQKSLATFVPFTGRGQIWNLSNNITLIDESYNSSPAALKAAIQNAVLRKGENNRVIAILGDMKELGEKSIEFHRNINLDGVDLIFCAGDLMKHLYDNAKNKQGFASNAEGIASIVCNHIQDRDIILVKGSHSTNMMLIVDKIKQMFSQG